MYKVQYHFPRERGEWPLPLGPFFRKQTRFLRILGKVKVFVFPIPTGFCGINPHLPALFSQHSQSDSSPWSGSLDEAETGTHSAYICIEVNDCLHPSIQWMSLRLNSNLGGIGLISQIFEGLASLLFMMMLSNVWLRWADNCLYTFMTKNWLKALLWVCRTMLLTNWSDVLSMFSLWLEYNKKKTRFGLL